MRSTALSLSFFIVTAFPVTGGSIRKSTEEPRVQGNGNSVHRIQLEATEIAGYLKRQSYKNELKQEPPKITILGKEEDFFLTVIVEDESLSEEETKSIAGDVLRFVRFRSRGHTCAYATYMALHRQTHCSELLRVQFPGIEHYSTEIAYPWVDLVVEWCAAFPTARSEQTLKIVFVVDGELAWLYGIKSEGLKVSENVAGYCFDSIELHPGVAHLFRSLYSQLASSGLAPTVDKPKSPDWWFELRQMLLEKYEIKWRTPVELNPGTLFD
jgi:hypothetical protein